MDKKQVIIVGAGAAGLGCAALLKQMGIKNKNMLVIERASIGNTFKAWPKEMRMITPSFPSNGYLQTDLNAITPDTSPAFSIGKSTFLVEYMNTSKILRHYEIQVQEHTEVTYITKNRESGEYDVSCNNSVI